MIKFDITFRFAYLYSIQKINFRHLSNSGSVFFFILFSESFSFNLAICKRDLPPSIASAIAEGHLNPITMEAFDHFPEAKACYDTRCVSELEQIDSNESQVTSTPESCISIFSVRQSSDHTSASKLDLPNI